MYLLRYAEGGHEEPCDDCEDSCGDHELCELGAERGRREKRHGRLIID